MSDPVVASDSRLGQPTLVNSTPSLDPLNHSRLFDGCEGLSEELLFRNDKNAG